MKDKKKLESLENQLFVNNHIPLIKIFGAGDEVTCYMVQTASSYYGWIRDPQLDDICMP